MSQQAGLNLNSIYLISVVPPALRVRFESSVVWVAAVDQTQFLGVNMDEDANSILFFKF